jgi:uncharacterized phage protein (TIGR02218 family)
MRTIPSGMASGLATGSSSLVFLLTITRKDGTVLHFTEADQDITYGGATYARLAGLTIGSIPYGLDGFSSGVDLQFGAAAATDPIQPAEIRDGVYDAAEVELRHYNLMTPGSAVQVFWGRVSDISRRVEGGVKLSAKGILSGANQIVVDRYMPMCIWFFCDSRCGLDAATYTFAGTITAIPSAYELTISGAAAGQADDAFKDGVLEFTSGDRAGLRVELRGSTAGAIKTFLAHPKGLAVGDSVSLLRGCGKRPEDCKSFGNFLRFGGQHKAGNAEEAASITYQDWPSV